MIVKLGVKALRSRTFRESDQFIDDFVDVLISLGGVYVKFLQGVLLSTLNPKSKHSNEKKLKVFEDNPDPKLSLEDIQRELGPARGYVQLTSLTPLGVGSYSAVYPGLLHDGNKVVVKLLKPGVKHEMKRDLRFLRQLSWIYGFGAPGQIPIDLGELYGSFKKACQKEVDFKSEIQFANELYLRYLNHPYIKVPKTYTEISGREVIVQEYIDGVSMTEAVRAKNNDLDPVEYMRQLTGTDILHLLQVFYYDMRYALCSGRRFHGDPHPGNLRITTDHKIAMLDFGIVAQPFDSKIVPYYLDKIDSDYLLMSGDIDLVRIMDSHFKFYMNSLYVSLESIYANTGKEMREFFEKMISALNLSIENATEAKKKKWVKRGSSVMLLTELIGDVKSTGLTGRVVNQTGQRALSTFYNMLDSLGIKHDVGMKVTPRISRDIRRDYPELFSKRPLLLPDLALENIYSWIEKVSTNNPELGSKIRAFIAEPKAVEVES